MAEAFKGLRNYFQAAHSRLIGKTKGRSFRRGDSQEDSGLFLYGRDWLLGDR